MIIRNDDVAFDTDVSLLRKFCDLCDAYGHTIIQGITPIGSIKKVSVYWDNDKIKDFTGIEMWSENYRLVDYLMNVRKGYDKFAVHGLWHTHAPTIAEIKLAKKFLRQLEPEYFIAPFNEGTYPEYVEGLKVLNTNCDRLETFHDNRTMPKTEIAYLHSWRYDNAPYNLGQLEQFFKTIAK